MDLFHSASIQGDALVDAPVYLVLLVAMVLIYIGDMLKSKAVQAILSAVVLLFYPFHEFFLYTTYDIHTCHIMAGFMALPIMTAYAIYRVTEKQDDMKHRLIVLAIGFFLVLCACSMDSFNLEQFKLYQGAVQ